MVNPSLLITRLLTIIALPVIGFIIFVILAVVNFAGYGLIIGFIIFIITLIIGYYILKH